MALSEGEGRASLLWLFSHRSDARYLRWCAELGMIAFPELGTAHYVRVHCSLKAQCTSTPSGVRVRLSANTDYPAFKIASLFERGLIMKTACFIAQSPRLGRRKINIHGQPMREIMHLHLCACYTQGAADEYGAGFRMKSSSVESDNVSGEYIGLFFSLDAPNDSERQIAERIQVRPAKFWERII